MDNTLLYVNNLSVSFQQQEVVKNISFCLRQGEILAIVGESGSGKSVTSLALLQLLPKSAEIKGDILFREHPLTQEINISKLSAAGLQQIRGNKIAMIFQEPMTSLNPVKTCGNQIAEALLWHKNTLSKKEAFLETLSLLEQVQLPSPKDIYHRYPHEISGGQKQRVMIALAMSCQPQLLICDEPTTALDVLVQKDIISLIKKLQRANNMSVLFISHDINLVSEIADRIALFYKGSLVEIGTTKEILHSPKHPYTKALLACRPGLYQPHQRLPVVEDFFKNAPSSSVKTKPLERQPIAAQNNTKPLALMSIKELNVWYGIKRNLWGKTTAYNKAVNNISFDVYKGETLGLVGASGCGKTTLGRAISQLAKIHSGEIIYKGQRIFAQSTKDRRLLSREIQMIFQDPYSALNPKITIGEAIAEPLHVHQIYQKKDIKTQVLGWIEKVGLQPKHYNRYPHEFSGGQRQRIVIARALAMKPSFVICDESVSALDVSVQAQILNLLNDLKAEFNFTSIFISHDLSVVKYLCDRIVVMNKGKIEEIGSTNQIYYHPQSAYTQALLSALPRAAL